MITGNNNANGGGDCAERLVVDNVLVTGIDTTAPVADATTLADVTAECEVTALTAPTATDNCEGSITGTSDATLPITTQGTTVVTWTYDDGNGNTSTQTQNVVIDDMTAPVADTATLADVTAECEVTALTAPTATDNCEGSITGTSDATLPITTQGTTVVTWTYDDGNGNTSTQTQNVVIDDMTAPVADATTLADVTAECEVTALTAPTATDNCEGSITGTSDATLPITTQGTTVVTWTYDDGNGNTSTQTQNVVIDDMTAPVADATTLADVTAECEVTALTAPTATDNCEGSITGTSDATLPITTQGTTVVTWTYDDGNGNTSTQTQNVVIDDMTAPVADTATLADVTAECEVTALTAPTATDNCEGSITGTSDATLPITTQGTTVVTWTYDDGNGNTSTQTQNVVIDDMTAPVADTATLADVTAECEVTALTAPTATDNCEGSITGTSDATLPITTQGTTVVTWTYDDGNGNTSTQTQNVVIDDMTAPVADATTLADVTAECEVTALTAPTATDNCEGSITGTSDATLPITTQGTTVVTWTYDDGNGNTSTQTQNVVIDDMTAPVADTATLADVTAECEVTALTAPTATDNCEGSITGTSDATLPITTQGTTVVTWTYDDGNGNTSTQTQNVVIDDMTAPVADATTLADVTAECEVTALTAPTATDNCEGSITGTSDATLPITTQGTTVVTWTYDDGNGNTSTQTQNVVIDDMTAPVADATTLADVTAECEVTALTAPTATDNCEGSITGTSDATLPITTQGTTVVTWTYDDGNGNTSTQTQNVVIDDMTAPVADTATLADVTAECEVTALTAPTATDNCEGSITGTSDATLPITTQGTTVVTWTYDDGNGNTSTQTQNVVIDDMTAPVADTATLADVTAECEVTALTAPTATDNCEGSITGTSDATLPITTQGTTVVTWTYDDGNGNTSTQTQNVVIDDMTAPVADATTLADVTAECEVTALTAPTATDNCEGSITGTSDATLPITTQGTTVVTWTYDDGNGNTSTQTQNVVIDDMTAPVADTATLADVTAECEVTALTAPTATDNCEGSITGTSDATLPITTQGTTVVTWTYDDGNGNTSTQTQNVVIDDMTAPVADATTLADVTAECEVTALTAPTATDNCEGSITGTSDATLPITTQGTTVVTWTYDDGNGNTSTQTQNVVIDDMTAPVADTATLADVTAECEVTALTAPTATDNCEGSITGTSDATLPITTQGTTVVTWTYDDGNGNTSTQTQNVVIDDMTAPVADATTLADVTAECEVTALTAPTATDNCEGSITGTSDATLPITTQGTTVVTWTYDDGNGNTSTQTQNVVIDDMTAPVADTATLADVTAECEVTALTAPTATDNCEGSITGTSDATLPITTQGTTVVTWTYDDGNGNTSTQTQNVVIDDMTAPVADATTLADVTAECEVTALTAPTATDNCEGSITGTSDATLPITTQGTTVVTWTYDDGNGNTSTQTQNVVIDDMTAPVADTATLADVTAECEVTALTAPTATDNCEGSITGTSDATLPITTQGTTVVTWTYDDGNGNTSTQTQNVVIDDMTAPVADATTLADVTAECEVTALTAPTATDNCEGSITGTSDATLPITTQGTTVVTWTYDDGNGNTSTQTQNVVIDDMTAPVADATTLADVTAECEVTALTAPTATDNCEGSITGTSDATLPITTQGTTVVTWTYDDGNGNTSTQTQNVVIDDMTAPVADATTLADVTAECEVTALTAPTATDNCEGSITGTSDATLPITTQGTTVVTWTYDDGNGNTSTQTQNVVIDDMTAPVADATTLADVTAECEVTALTAPTATDNCEGSITGTSDATLPITTQGTTVVTWTYDDGNGNTSTQTQNVVIDDMTAPVADTATLADVTAECEVTALTAPTATDNCEGSITGTSDATLPITTQGTTVVTWTYDDGNGNTSTQTQNVVIDDMTAPVADTATLADVTAECEVTALTAPTATDNCEGSITGTSDATLPITTQGTTVVTWTYDDGNGNTSTQTQNVVIDDMTAPVADATTLADVTAECEVTALTAPTATDNCEGSITGTSDATLPITTQGTTVVTWTYDDGNGNTSTQTQNVVIDDMTAPVADTATLADVTAECEVTALTAPTATDNCEGSITGTSDATLPITTQGTTVVTWTYDDGNGNTSTQTQNVVIDDMTAPVADATTLADVTAECEVTALTAPTATDNCEGSITGTSDATLPITTQGTTVVTWTYDDGNGNTSTQTQNVVIDDMTAPVADATTLADVTAECEVTALTAPTATDNCEGSITGTSDATLPITTQGTTVVTWTYDDGNGNTSTQTQNVVIDDMTAPVADTATLADVTAECEVTALTAPTATDNCEGSITGTSDATLPITTQGTTVVTWTYDDGNGNTSTQTQNVVIDDMTAPTITCPAPITQGVDAGVCGAIVAYTAPLGTDNCSGSMTTQTAGLSSGSVFPVGTTTNTFVVTDAGGNTATCSFDVTVTVSPLDPGSFNSSTIDGCVGYNPPTYNATAASGGATPYSYQWELDGVAISGATSEDYNPPAFNSAGIFVLRRRVTDECGTIMYSNDKTFNIVEDPTITLVNDTTICSGETYTMMATTTGGNGTCTFNWESSPDDATWTSEVNNSSSTFTTPTTLTSNTYYRVRRNCTGAGCNDPYSNSILVTVLDIADLSLTKTANVSTVNIGGEILFTIVVTNSGPCDVTDISVRDELPTGLTYNATNSTVPAGTSYSSGIWDLTSLTLEDGDTATLIIAADVGLNCDDITNTAEIITSSRPDPDSTPDSGD